MKVLMLAPLQKENFERIEQCFLEDNFIYVSTKSVTQDMVDQCDVIVGNPPLSLDLHRPHLQAILLNSAGSDAYVKEGILSPQTLLANASGTYGCAIAEHTLGMIFAINKNFKTYVHQMDQGLWQPHQQGKELYRQTVVIVGLGDLGYTIAKRLKAFECYIIGVKRRKSKCPDVLDEIYTTESLDDVLPRADFVVLALPQSLQTYHLFDKEKLLRMKKDAVLINVGRGSAIATSDLIEVLNRGHLYGVGLDVLEEEPLPPAHPLWKQERVLLTPHVSGGYVWESARHYYTELVIRNLHHLKAQEELENLVDFETGYRYHTTL